MLQVQLILVKIFELCSVAADGTSTLGSGGISKVRKKIITAEVQ